MANGDEEKKGGFYKIQANPVDVGEMSAERLKEISNETGAEFPIEVDPTTGKPFTKPTLVVVVPGSKKK